VEGGESGGEGEIREASLLKQVRFGVCEHGMLPKL
jgi:hypothetical protein